MSEENLQSPVVENPPPVAPPPVAGKSTASLVLGIISLVFWLLPLAGFPVSIVGLVLGVKKKYTTGIVLNVIGLVLTTANAAVGAYMGATGQLGR